MSTLTYLDATNIILRELNEVPLTEASFANAVGIQQFIKDTVNRSLADVVTESYKWSFLSSSTSEEPHLGNEVVETVVGQRWYDLKPTSSGVDDDFSFIDWESFTLTDKGIAGATAPYKTDRLQPILLSDWIKRFSEKEAESAADSDGYHTPRRIIRHPDGSKVGFSPIPDDEYKVYFYAWKQMPFLTVFGDTFLFQDRWVHSVLIPRMRYYAWMFKENPRQSQMADGDWKKGIRRMREQLLENTAEQHFSDDRIRYP